MGFDVSHLLFFTINYYNSSHVLNFAGKSRENTPVSELNKLLA